jgi:hypothetical protein
LLGTKAYGQAQPPVNGPVAHYRPDSSNIPGNAPGYVTTQSPGQVWGDTSVPLRPNLGFPAWVSSQANWPGFYTYTSPANCPNVTGSPVYCMENTFGALDVVTQEYPVIPAPNRRGYGYVAIGSNASQYHNAHLAGPPSNMWANEIPLRSATPGLTVSGSVYTIADLANTHMNDVGGNQIAYVLMDWYALVRICGGPNFTGVCKDYGYGCQYSGGICPGDTTAERNAEDAGDRSKTDIVFDSSVPSFNAPHPSIRIGYGF